MSTKRRVTVNTLKSEIKVSTARSGGPGGQHVNKVETKVILNFNINDSQILTPDQKSIIIQKLSSKLTKDGALMVSSEASRSQLKNKELAFKKLDKLLARAFAVEKRRKKTRPTKASVERRIKGKKHLSEKKKNRRKLD